MACWLFKSEPKKWSWEQQKKKGEAGEQWDGVRNYQARNNMRMMQTGDKGFFYHSNEGLEIVGIVEVCREAHQDTTADDARWQCVDIRAVSDLPRPVSLREIKANPNLSEMALVKFVRLSVQPVREEEWEEILRMSETKPPVWC